jgi:uncharacterized protein YbjT (DUF2867 family)
MAAETPKTILVAGGTGRLGLPLVLRLLARGHRVRALTRDPGSSRAVELAARGAEPLKGDFDDRNSLRAAIDGVDAVFGAGTAHQAGPEGEARHGRNLADAVLAAGSPWLVYASGDGADRPTGVPVLESKRAVERHIAELDLPATILAPVYFMENAFNPWNLPALRSGRFPLPLPPDRQLQQMAVEDLISFAVLALERGEALGAGRIALASDEVTGVAAAAAVSRAAARPFEFEQVPLDGLAPPMRLLFDWLDRTGHAVDTEALKRDYTEIGWHSFESWAAAQSWSPAAGAATTAAAPR